MGWDVELVDENGVVSVPNHNEGSIQSCTVDGKTGTCDADIAITYNYSRLYHLVLGETLKEYLRDRKAEYTISGLKKIVEKLGTNRYKRLKEGHDTFDFENGYEIDYWCPTPGNAGHIAALLLDWAQLHPEAKWEITSE